MLFKHYILGDDYHYFSCISITITCIALMLLNLMLHPMILFVRYSM